MTGFRTWLFHVLLGLKAHFKAQGATPPPESFALERISAIQRLNKVSELVEKCGVLHLDPAGGEGTRSTTRQAGP